MKIIIIEDEKLTAKDLAKTIEDIAPEIEIVSILQSVENAIAFLKTNPQLDLIFSDIELGDGTSFEIFEKLQLKIPIIFCTAYNQYALDAFKTYGIDYVLKPFSRQSIENALLKFQTIKEELSSKEENYNDLMQVLKQKLNPKSQSVIVHQGDKIIPLNTKDIALFYISNESVFAYTFQGKKYVVSQNMESLEHSFTPDFFRANRQFLVNRTAIKDASLFFNRKIVINLSIPFEEQIAVGRLKVSAFTDWLQNS